MCIVLLTTAHPRYALIVINNRDEFILRPTSRPHCWTTKASRRSSRTATPDPSSASHKPATNGHAHGNHSEGEIQYILSSRDLLRAEQGTWLGITKSGHFAVLTNYRELEPGTGAPSVSGTKSRGGMVTAWLGNSSEESVGDFVEGMIADGGTTGVGGFSLICGKLRRQRGAKKGIEPLAILSNKALHPDQIPWIAGNRGETVGLSNAAFDSPAEWPKVTKGKALLEKVIAEAVENGLGEAALQEKLFWILDRDELPKSPEMKFEDYFKVLQESIFIPLVGNQEHQDAMVKAAASAKSNGHADPALRDALEKVEGAQRPESNAQPQGFSTGMYGTQRQTVILVDWNGIVTYTERALFDAHGHAIEKGKGDVTIRFAIAEWDESD